MLAAHAGGRIPAVPAHPDPRADRVAARLRALEGLEPAGRHDREAALDALASLLQPLSPGAGPTHVTASAVVVGDRGVILHHHRRLDRWLQPGGHIDPGEEPAEAARRETLEETGLEAAHPRGGPALLDVDVHALPRPCRPWAEGRATDGAAGAPDCVHVDLRYLLHADGRPCPRAGESPRVDWFTWSDALAAADDGLARSLRRAAAALEQAG